MILLAAACKTASSSSSQSSSDTQTNTASNEKQTTDETSQTTTTKTVEQDPSKTTTTENEYELIPVPGEPSKPPVPVLKHQKIKVEEKGKKTASVDTQKQQDTKTSFEGSIQQQVLDHQKRSEEDELKSAPSVGCAMAGWMWAVLIISGALGLITGFLKLAGKKIPFVG